MSSSPGQVASKRPQRATVTEPVVRARCILCKAQRDIRAGEVAPKDMPVCACGGIMVAVRASARRVRGPR